MIIQHACRSVKHACIAFAALACLAALPVGAAMNGEPTEFRGVPFGREYTPTQDFSCMTDSEEGNFCTRPADDLNHLGVPLASLSYLFMERQLYTVEMEVAGRENYDRLRQEMEKIHGRPMRQQGGTLSFRGKIVDILLHFDASRNRGTVAYINKNVPCKVGE